MNPTSGTNPPTAAFFKALAHWFSAVAKAAKPPPYYDRFADEYWHLWGPKVLFWTAEAAQPQAATCSIESKKRLGVLSSALVRCLVCILGRLGFRCRYVSGCLKESMDELRFR
jgi:hypothetical protein